jgi:hypothetical protein
MYSIVLFINVLLWFSFPLVIFLLVDLGTVPSYLFSNGSQFSCSFGSDLLTSAG